MRETKKSSVSVAVPASGSGATRREFLVRSVGVAAFGVTLPTLIPGSVLGLDGTTGANDRFVIGFVGCGGRARQLMEHIPHERGKIVAVCDFWRQKMLECVREKKESGLIADERDWRMYDSDMEMFDHEKLDVAFVATQDHCRTLPAMRAVLAGLDVYAEKPLTAYIAEGRALVECVRKHNCVFQVGSQQRSMRVNEYGCRIVRDGTLGKVRVVQGINYPGPRPIPDDLSAEAVPDGFNWDAWQGPTRARPFNGALLGWMQWWDYSGGEMTNWGAHGLDQIQWALGASESGPVRLWPLETEEEAAAEPDRPRKIGIEYVDGTQVRFELASGPWGGAIFRCERGNLEINRNNLKANPEELIADAPEEDPPEGPTWIARPHIENFFDCVVSRERPHADVEIGHRSASLCHLVNICRDLGRELHWNPVKEQFCTTGDAVGDIDTEANARVSRPRRSGYELPTG